MNNVLLIGGIVLVIVIILLTYTKSTFIDDILTNNYGNCTRDNRHYPQGKIPGSYLTLTKPEREGLFVNFVLNDPNKMN